MPPLGALKRARAAARERAWLLRAEAGRPLPTVTCAGRAQPGLVIDLDATLVTCHSEKEGTAATYKHGYGYHPMLAWLDNTGEALAGVLRPGNAGANDAADHAAVIDDALAQIPDGHRYGTPILVRADSAGGTREFLAHLRSLRDERGLEVSFSVGFRVTNAVKDAIGRLPESAWTVAVDAAGTAPAGRRDRAAGRPGRRPHRTARRSRNGRAGRPGCGSWSAGNGHTPARS